MADSAAVIGFPRWTDRITFAQPAGSTSSATYPVTNLGSLPLAQVWRSASADAADTQFTATLDRARGVRLLALVGHNISLLGKIRVRLYSDTDLTALLYDSGWIDAWPVVYTPDQLEWEDDNWWSGQYADLEITGYRWTRPLWLDAQVLARGIKVEVDDTTNSAGYIECGMFEVSQGWQVGINFSYGAQYGFRFRSQSVEAIGGAKYFERRDKPRVFKGQISYLEREEAMAKAFEHQRQMDIDTPFLWMPDPTSTTNLLREVFLARNVDPGLMAYSTFNRDQVPLAFEEVM
ncbi:hypothetical protein M5E06_17925 [Azospirillum sp. A1-3]|uniref:hypothetical protein n=1 Tax=Azospirillum sp. A1-3 TaxID=185874 RepID=UPI00207750DB|nr:hypothetical protein [Azospirillum sp. A1-3]MCM8736015.1 hypothetical protein [Azospirillum sp. A1-3]